MKFSRTFVFYSLILLFSFPLTVVANKTQCPDLLNLKFEGINNGKPIGQNLYMTYRISQFNGKKSWIFFLLPVKGQSLATALDNSNQILQKMTSPAVPVNDNGSLYCLYDTDMPATKAIVVDADNIFIISKIQQMAVKA